MLEIPLCNNCATIQGSFEFEFRINMTQCHVKRTQRLRQVRASATYPLVAEGYLPLFFESSRISSNSRHATRLLLLAPSTLFFFVEPHCI